MEVEQLIERVAEAIENCATPYTDHNAIIKSAESRRELTRYQAKAAIDAMEPDQALMDEMAEALGKVESDSRKEWANMSNMAENLMTGALKEKIRASLTKYRKAKGE